MLFASFNLKNAAPQSACNKEINASLKCAPSSHK